MEVDDNEVEMVPDKESIPNEGPDEQVDNNIQELITEKVTDRNGIRQRGELDSGSRRRQQNGLK